MFQTQFGAQVVMSTETNTDDNPLVAQFSNVEVRQAGQGLKLGKYPIHFHMVGKESLDRVAPTTHDSNAALITPPPVVL